MKVLFPKRALGLLPRIERCSEPRRTKMRIFDLKINPNAGERKIKTSSVVFSLKGRVSAATHFNAVLAAEGMLPIRSNSHHLTELLIAVTRANRC